MLWGTSDLVNVLINGVLHVWEYLTIELFIHLYETCIFLNKNLICDSLFLSKESIVGTYYKDFNNKVNIEIYSLRKIILTYSLIINDP